MLSFLADGGEMGGAMRSHDWASTPLGPAEGWPTALKTLVGVMLGSNQPMFIAWGPERTLLYNDRYADILQAKHPGSLGRDFLQVWAEIERDLRPIVDQAYTGVPVHMDDITLIMERRGYREETHFAFSYTPVRGEDGAVAGFFCPCNEITGQVLAERELRASEERLRLVVEGARDYAILTTDMDRRVTGWSPGAEAAFGYAPDEILGRDADVLWTPEDRAAGQPEHETGTASREGRAPDVRWHLRQDGGGVFLDGAVRPLHNDDGEQVGFLKIARDDTDRRRRDEALRETEERYRLAARATNDVIWDWRMADGHVVWSDAVGTLFGHSERETSADWWMDHIHPDDRGRVGESIHAVIDGGGEAWSDAYRFRRADGSHAHVLDRGTVLRDADGRAVRMIGAMLDLTERRQLGERLAASEQRYQTLFDSIESGFCVVEVRLDGPDGRIDYRVVEANPAFYKQTGFPDEVLGRWLREAVPTLEEHWFEIYGRVARTGVPERFEEGSIAMGRWFDVYTFRVGEPEEGRVAILFNDISARRTAEETLQRLNETLEERVEQAIAERDRTWNNARDLLLVVGTDGVFQAVNPAWTTVLGWRREELVGRSYLDLIHPDDHPSSEVALATATQDDLSGYENRYRHKDGSYRRISWVAAPEGELIYANGRDVTAEREQAEALSRAEEQLRQAQKMEAVGQLTGGIAHDFNNLLTGITGNLELLQVRTAQGRYDAIERYVGAASGAANRAASLTQRLLAFSRRQTLDPKPTDVNRLVAGMDDLIRRSIGPTVHLEVVGAGGLWPTLVDAPQLENALLNLCINARDAMPDGGRITIETANKWLDARAAGERELPAGQYVSLCVTDTGTGMTPDVVERAFDPFFTTKPMGAGTGLGLSMIYGFVRQSGGQVRIYSEVGQGTTMCLYLPRHHGEGEAEPDGASHRAELQARAGETVLVVDDEPTIRQLVAEVLEEAGYGVLEAADGPAGVKLLESPARIDLLVTDVGLPGGMNGRQVADAGRALRPGLKVLFITGYAENAAVGNGHLEPGMELLTKPFAMDDLATRIRQMVEAEPAR